jgi:hypothetical protein
MKHLIGACGLAIAMALASTAASAQPAPRRPAGAGAARQPRAGNPAGASAAAAKFKPDQKVEAMWMKKWLPATVVSVQDPWVRIRFDEDGFTMNARPENVRPRAGAAAGTAGAGGAARAGAPAAAGTVISPGAARPGASVPSVKESDAPAAAVELPAPVEADASGVQELAPDAAAAWSYKPPAGAPQAINPRNVTLPPAYPVPPSNAIKGRSNWERFVMANIPDVRAPFVYLTYQYIEPFKPRPLRVHKADVSAGKLAAIYDFPTETRLIDVSADGRLALLRSDKGHPGSRGRLDVYDVSGPQPKHVVGFEPFKGAGVNQTDVTHGRLIDGAHLLTSNGQQLMVWRLDGVKAVWSIKTEKGGQSSLSPDRATVALSTPEAVYLLDAHSGKTAGRIASDRQVSGLSFKPDQARLAAQTDDMRLLVWDLSSGKVVHDLPLQFGIHAGYARWLEGEQLLFGSRDLFDLSKGLVVWQYVQNGAEAPLIQFGNRFAMVDEESQAKSGGGRVLSFFTLPHPAARQRAAALDAKDVMVVRPGAKVSLDVQFDGPPEARQKAEARARAELERNGVTVADGQPVRLLISSAPGETKDLGYGRTNLRTGRREVEETVSVTQQLYRVALLAGEKTVLWETRSGFTGQGLFLKEENKSMVQVIEESKAKSYRFFENVQIPRLVPKPLAMVPPGRSLLTPQGPKGDKIAEPVKIEAPPAAAKPQPAGSPF